MKKTITLLCLLSIAVTGIWARTGKQQPKAELWPDGTPISSWFHDTTAVNLRSLGKQYKLTDYGIFADGNLHTEQIQALIDHISAQGGGVLVVPAGVYHTGGIYFKPGTHLHLQEGAVLQGSDNIADYRLDQTRIEGENCLYFEGLINVKDVDGFTLTGPGTIDGNGLRYHQAFWLRRQWNRQCTNKDEQRPRLLWISNCKNVCIEGVRLQNSPFWTTHIYNCQRVRIQNVQLFSLSKPDAQKGPSTDAIDLDVVQDVLIRHCYMEVNDDAVALKGGKGPWADDFEKYPGNGANCNVLIEDCTYGFCHSCLTCGSESVFNHNILLRRVKVNEATRLLWLKMRPDTPQRYEYITVQEVEGNVKRVLYIHPWTQFYDLKGRIDTPKSYCDHITMQRCNLQCEIYQDVELQPDQYELSNFLFNQMQVTQSKGGKSVLDDAGGHIYSVSDAQTSSRYLEVAGASARWFMQKYDPVKTFMGGGKVRETNLWTRAVFHEGLSALYEVDSQPEYYNYNLAMAEGNHWMPRHGLETRDADNYCCFQTYIDLYRLSPASYKLENVIKKCDMIVSNPDNADWWWIDALQMGMPAFAKLGITTGNEKYIGKMWQMYEYTRNHTDSIGLFNPAEGLWWRDKDFNPPYVTATGRQCYWSRGNGWVLAALARVMNELPTSSMHYNDYKSDFLAMCEALRKVQRPDGFWNVDLGDPDNYGGIETSGTSLFVYGMAWGIRQGLLPAHVYRPVVEKAWKALETIAWQPSGWVGYIQGTGKEPKDSQPVTLDGRLDFEDFGIGCFLLAATEMHKLSLQK